VTSLDPANGQTWWREEFLTREDYVAATPVHDGHRLLVSGLMFELDPTKPAAAIVFPPEAKPLAKRVLHHMSMPLLSGDHIYASNMRGQLQCLDAKTGNMLWENTTVTTPGHGASFHLTANGDTTLIFTDEGNLIRARLSLSGYEELGRFHLIDPNYQSGKRVITWAVPAFANRHVFARNHAELVCASLVEAP
jgi:outer membrane protein assembly factor BamB